MKDRQAASRRPLVTGMTREEFYEGHRADFGTTWDKVRKDVPFDPGRQLEGSGIPMNMPPVVPEFKRRPCLGLTKSGNDCGANPVKGKDFCQGHLKQLEALLDDEA
jgi:hypothetical protein